MGFRYATGRLGQKKAVSTILPTDIAGLQLWLDFSDASTLFVDAGVTNVSANNDLIYHANDKSGNSNHLTQSIEVKRPLYKLAVQNGLSVSRYDGVNDFLLSSGEYQIINTLDGTWTAFAIANRTASGTTPVAGVVSGDGYDTSVRLAQFLVFDDYTSLRALSFNSDGSNINTVSQTDQSKMWLMGSKRAANSIYLYKNGNLANSTTNATKTPRISTSLIGVGVSTLIALQYLLEGDIAEVLIYNSPLSDENRQAIESYLNNKWAIY